LLAIATIGAVFAVRALLTWCAVVSVAARLALQPALALNSLIALLPGLAIATILAIGTTGWRRKFRDRAPHKQSNILDAYAFAVLSRSAIATIFPVSARLPSRTFWASLAIFAVCAWLAIFSIQPVTTILAGNTVAARQPIGATFAGDAVLAISTRGTISALLAWCAVFPVGADNARLSVCAPLSARPGRNGLDALVKNLDALPYCGCGTINAAPNRINNSIAKSLQICAHSMPF
jgi:hypothetical protein